MKVEMDQAGLVELQKSLDVYLKVLANEVVTEAKILCPVDTGNLRDSIKILEERKDEIDIGSEADYANFIEFGTRNMVAQPYLRPALDLIVNNNK
jgi:HK97 gp10 family phage protein